MLTHRRLMSRRPGLARLLAVSSAAFALVVTSASATNARTSVTIHQSATTQTAGKAAARPFASTVRRAGPASCRDLRPSVKVSPHINFRYRIGATLCRPLIQRHHRVLQILLPGIGNDRRYWDINYRPGTYSYVRAAARAGVTTLNTDRLGVGTSDTPARKITVPADAFVLHQLVQRARRGNYGNFGRIVIGGFSAGGAVAIMEASIYRDADAVLVEDFMHTPGPALPGLAGSLYDARTDPVIARPSLPAGYLTTKPGTRENVFISPAFAEPELVTLDEQTKSINSAAELPGVGAVLGDRALSRRINVPVLLVQGQLDPFFCSDPACSALQKESAFYGPAAHLKKLLVPSAAHAVNEHRVAPLVNRIVADWTYRSSQSH